MNKINKPATSGGVVYKVYSAHTIYSYFPVVMRHGCVDFGFLSRQQ
jgi:hypothetical protein